MKRKVINNNVINLRVPEELKKDIIEYCQVSGIEISQLLRDYLLRVINDYKKQGKLFEG